MWGHVSSRVSSTPAVCKALVACHDYLARGARSLEEHAPTLRWWWWEAKGTALFASTRGMTVFQLLASVGLVWPVRVARSGEASTVALTTDGRALFDDGMQYDARTGVLGPLSSDDAANAAANAIPLCRDTSSPMPCVFTCARDALALLKLAPRSIARVWFHQCDGTFIVAAAEDLRTSCQTRVCCSMLLPPCRRKK